MKTPVFLVVAVCLPVFAFGQAAVSAQSAPGVPLDHWRAPNAGAFTGSAGLIHRPAFTKRAITAAAP